MRATTAESREPCRRCRAPRLVLLLALTGGCATSGRGAPTGGTGEAGLEEITPASVAGLQPVCTFDTGDAAGFHIGPTASGVVYLTTDTLTFAVQGATCTLLWKHEHASPPTASSSDPGIAHLDGRIFRTYGDGHVLAIDAAAGRTLWDIAIAPAATGTPTPSAGGIRATPSGVLFTEDRGGNLLALEATTGRELWRGQVGLPIGAGIVTYTAGGHHLVAAGGRSEPQGGRSRLVVFGVRGPAGPERRRPLYID